MHAYDACRASGIEMVFYAVDLHTLRSQAPCGRDSFSKPKRKKTDREVAAKTGRLRTDDTKRTVLGCLSVSGSSCPPRLLFVFLISDEIWYGTHPPA